MEKSMQSNLCRGLRASGIPRDQAHQLMNIFQKWYDASGPEWVNDRIKAYRQWYETFLAGDPVPPVWFKHDKHNMPLGIWAWVFKLPTAKALSVLSMNTILYEKEVSQTQKEKFLKGLKRSGTCDEVKIEGLISIFKDLRLPFKGRVLKDPLHLEAPTLFDMNGSVPIHEGHSTIRVNGNIGKAGKALEESWKSVPKVTYRFVDDQALELIPTPLIFDEFGYYVMPKLPEIVGRVSVIQQPELKARWVGNPNRVLQKTLDPLKNLYMEAAKRTPTDVTHDQEAGIRWAQSKLRQGITLSGCDLTSASDKLSVKLCLKLVESVYPFESVPGYTEYRDYLLKVSKSPWFCPDLNEIVRWEQGTVLGTGPSFGLLTLTNNVVALGASFALESSRNPRLFELPIHEVISLVEDNYRVVGDDIIMVADMQKVYTYYIKALGGEVNVSKTLTSDKVSEFAGRVITPNNAYLKRIKYAEATDNSFMSYMAQLGDQASWFLRTRQRNVYNEFKFVPGIAVPGPWSQDSHKEPLELRFQWYLSCVEPVLHREDPDILSEEMDMSLLRAILDFEQQGGSIDRDYLEPAYDLGYLPRITDTRFKVGGDPRSVDGQTLLDALEKHLVDGSITTYSEWKENISKDVSVPTDSVSRNVISENQKQTLEKSDLSPIQESDRGFFSWDNLSQILTRDRRNKATPKRDSRTNRHISDRGPER